MALLSLTVPMKWLIADFLVGATILLAYQFIPVAYRASVNLTRWVVLPYLALLFGGVSPRLMGLTGINWLTSFGLGLGLIVMIAGFLVLVRSAIDFAAPEAQAATVDTSRGQDNSFARIGRTPISLTPLFYAGAEEFHWSFLRGALWESQLYLSGQFDETAYWMIWLAALLAIPAIIRFHSSWLARFLRLFLLLLSTILFIYTQNFWLCWLLHGLVLLLLIP